MVLDDAEDSFVVSDCALRDERDDDSDLRIGGDGAAGVREGE